MVPRKARSTSPPPESKGSSAGSPQAEAFSGNDRPYPFPIVGVGASAGGLEAMSDLFKNVQSNLGIAFILVPHLDPQRESAVSQILARTTSMPVVEIENGMTVQPNHVYVIPPNCELEISETRLRTTPREQGRPVNTTIDVFFRSLAAAHGANAIGVILSGTASDGTLGLSAIKGEGGITFAQDTRSSKYDGMPSSAIAAGCVDFILPPEEIANELGRIRSHPYVAGPSLGLMENEEGVSGQMSQIFRLLRRVTRVDFSEYKPPTIARRVQRRMVLHRLERLSDYVAFLQRDREEVKALYQDLLINVTSFFRNPEAFDVLKQVVYPAILQARKPSAALRIWVPGCSTGEEAYSHAISLVEFLGEQHVEIPIQIFGTDLSEGSIQRARAGLYKESIEADVSAARLRRFFDKSEAGYQISKMIRDLCVFSTQNVFNDPPFSRMDLVSCRNVMIYLSQSLQKRVIPVFHYALNPAGFLMIGNTEGLLGAGSELFDMADKKQKIYRKRLVSAPLPFAFSMGNSDREADIPELPVPPARQPEVLKAPLELQREADRLLLSRYAPPAVVINDQMEILQTRGRTGAYLELAPGKASLNLLKMARPGLLFELQNAIDEAKKSGAETERRDIHVEANGNSHTIDIRVLPFRTPIQEQHSYLVIFDPVPVQPAAAAQDVEPLTESERTDKEKQIAQLKQELSATKEYLQSIIEMQEATNEELQSANEEIQSGNEELQSTNEELQTSKEELESANEELRTVNEEMQHRNDLLTQANNDLTNLINSVNLPMVMVGSDLAVRRFTPQAGTVLGLVGSDIGRPIPRLNLKTDIRALEEAMIGVMREVQPRQLQVRNAGGLSFTLRLNPYRTLDNRIDGVVLTMVDRNSDDAREMAKPSAGKPASAAKKSPSQKKR